MWMTSDRGACQLADDPTVQLPIKIVHFGMKVREPGCECIVRTYTAAHVGNLIKYSSSPPFRS